ncbi:hypothetical protein PV682_17410 [Streptomyces niveiscabiei]|uniref:hypothetical protein n=1 Tax=Streptomyces niveiscabiei TaxID=164115 RepID=UPI0029B23BCC|nr:hypothetical protein [Streptomyces niveiscabiei]MDX3383231.1 hypothetical protein [Streptomyces niveiscabiei]
MSFARRLSGIRSHRTAVGAGVAGFTLLAAAFSGIGQAQAASQWTLWVNAPGATGSIQIQEAGDGQFRGCARTNLQQGGRSSTRVGTYFADSGSAAGIWVHRYSDAACQHKVGGPVRYNIHADEDRDRFGSDCRDLTVWADSTQHRFGNC